MWGATAAWLDPVHALVDAKLGEQLASLGHHCDVVMVLGPVQAKTDHASLLFVVGWLW